MTQISKKAYKGLPVGIKVRKPHYYYQDFLEVFNDNAEKYVELREFEGLDYSFNRSQVTFDEKVLWNGYTSPSCERILAPSGETYLTSIKKLVYTVNGNVVNDNNIISGFDKSNYLQIGNIDLSTGKSFEMFTKVTTGSDITSIQVIFTEKDASYFSNFRVDAGHFCANVSLHNSSTNKVLTTSETATSVQPNTTYWVKFVYDNETKTYSLFSSIDNEQWNLEASLTVNQLMTNWIWNIGCSAQSKYEYPFSGSIDLNESYIKIDDKVVWGKDAIYVVEGTGCFDNITDVQDERTLTAFVKDSEILLSTDEEKEGYTWANNVTIPEHELVPIYKKKFTESNADCKYIYQDGNVLVSINTGGILVPNEDFYYNFIPQTSFFDYDVRFTTKITTASSVSGKQVIGHVGGTASFTLSSGKLCMYNQLTANTALTVNTTYWVRVAEIYSVSTGQYTHRIAYIIDNGYTKETLPDESEWVVKTLTNTTPWFSETTKIYCLGSESDTFKGIIDLNNVWVDYGNTTNIGDGGRLYQTKWKILEKV